MFGNCRATSWVQSRDSNDPWQPGRRTAFSITPLTPCGVWEICCSRKRTSRDARKMYEQALALRTSAGDKLTIAETQLALADLSLEEARSPAEQETASPAGSRCFSNTKSPRRRNRRRGASLPARCSRRVKQRQRKKRCNTHGPSQPKARIQKSVGRPRSLRLASRPPETTLPTPLPAVAARKELAAIITKSRELGYMGIELDARLALAEIEMKTGQITAGRAHLIAIESDAKAKGYNLIARKAAIARGFSTTALGRPGSVSQPARARSCELRVSAGLGATVVRQ